jgi:hypothetical protein
LRKASLLGIIVGGKFWHLIHTNLDSNLHKQYGINSNGGFPSILFPSNFAHSFLFWHNLFGFAMAISLNPDYLPAKCVSVAHCSLALHPNVLAQIPCPQLRWPNRL